MEGDAQATGAMEEDSVDRRGCKASFQKGASQVIAGLYAFVLGTVELYARRRRGSRVPARTNVSKSS